MALSSFNSPMGQVKSSMASVWGTVVELLDDEEVKLSVDCEVEIIDELEFAVDEVVCVDVELLPVESANAPAAATTRITITTIMAEATREIESSSLTFPEK
jgi:hypothetical protein